MSTSKCCAAKRRSGGTRRRPTKLGRVECVGFWVLSRYEDVAMVSRDAARFSCWENTVLWVDVAQNPTALEMQRAGLSGMDPPQHTDFRRLVQGGFTPRATAAFEPFIRDNARSVVADLAARNTTE